MKVRGEVFSKGDSYYSVLFINEATLIGHFKDRDDDSRLLSDREFIFSSTHAEAKAAAEAFAEKHNMTIEWEE